MDITELHETITAIEHRNASTLSKKRVRHIQRVRKTALGLARRFHVSPAPVDLAAVAHDMDRELTDAEYVSLAGTIGLEIGTQERSKPVLLHGAVAAWRLEHEYDVTDESVLLAVRHHTFGDPRLGDIGLILYTADYVEPGRKYLDDSDRRKILSMKTLAEIVVGVIEHSRSRYSGIDSRTDALYRSLVVKSQ